MSRIEKVRQSLSDRWSSSPWWLKIILFFLFADEALVILLFYGCWRMMKKMTTESADEQ